MTRDIYGSFLLDDMEFAISATVIQEIVNEPVSYNPVPLAPGYVLGVFNLRGSIVPVVDLRQLFNLPEYVDNYKGDGRVAIIHDQGFRIGIQFDETGDVFDGAKHERTHVANDPVQIDASLITGVFSIDNGERVVQILNPVSLSDLGSSANALAYTQGQKRKTPLKLRKKCISFIVGSSHCAFDIHAIQEIVQIDELSNTTLAGKNCIGSIDIRGVSIPVINFMTLLGQDVKQSIGAGGIAACRVVVMNNQNNHYGLLVNSIQGIENYHDEDILEFTVLGSDAGKLFIGCIASDGVEGETLLLDHGRLASQSEIVELIDGNNRLFNDQRESDSNNSKKRPGRTTYLTLSLGNRFALKLSDVREVIDHPEQISHMLNMSRYVKGLVNLRGSMVPVVDMRAMYEIESPESTETASLLVFETRSIRYALVVDSVDSIVTLSDDCKVPTASIISNRMGSKVTEDAPHALLIKGDEAHQTLLLLDPDALLARTGLDAGAVPVTNRIVDQAA